MNVVQSFNCETQFIRVCSPHRQKGGPATLWTYLTAQPNQPNEEEVWDKLFLSVKHLYTVLSTICPPKPEALH